MNTNKKEKYLMIQGIMSVIEGYTSSYHRDYMVKDEIIKHIGLSKKEDLVRECISNYVSVYESSNVSFDENSNWFLNFISACQTLDISFEDGTPINTMFKNKAKDLYNSLSNVGNFSYSDRHDLKTYSFLVNLVGLGDQPVSNIKNMLSKIENQHRWSFSYFSESVSQFISILAKDDYDYIYNTYIKTIKKKKAYLREPVYMGIIRSGKLDKKTARKIRSDASESVSYNCVQELFKYSSKYSSEDFQTLFTQFGDSNYYQVRRYLAQEVDPKQLMCLMGTSCDETKRIMQNRIREYYASLEEGE